MMFLWIPQLVLSALTVAKPACKCTYGESCWPSDDAFTQLQTKLSAPLIYPFPPEAACYPNMNVTGPSCDEVRAQTANGTWRADQPGSMQAPNWEGYIWPNGTIDACYLNTTLGQPCSQGSVPPVGVVAHSASDIQAAVRFAAEHNLRLAIKSTGHDFSGRSTARGGLLIWTHFMKNITFDESANTLKVAAGVQWREAYDAAESHKRTLVGGISGEGSVGAAGGWVQGGGHSAISPKFGLGVDNVLDFELVTASGDLIHANSRQNTDLFWALRGGGGGTWGVLVSVTYKTHPLVPAVVLNIQADLTTNTTKNNFIYNFFSHHQEWSDKLNLGGYVTLINGHLSVGYAALDVTEAHMNETLEPFRDYAFKTVPEGQLTWSVTTFPSFYDWKRTFTGNDTSNFSNGVRVEPISRLVSKDKLKTSAGLWGLTLFFANQPYGQFHLVAGGAVSTPDPDSLGLGPAWRSAIGQMMSGIAWDETSSYLVIKALRAYGKVLSPTMTAVCGDGAYFNEGWRFETNWKKLFFGDHYSRLEEVKKKYDPKDMFIVAAGVGSERWDDDQTCPS